MRPRSRAWLTSAAAVISLVVFAMLAFQSFRTYRQLSAMERHSEYSQRDYD